MENCGITAAEGGLQTAANAGPRGAAPPRADMESAPTDRGNPAANRKPRATATHVGAHIVRPGNPAADRKPRATATHVGAHIVRPGNPAADRKPRAAATHVGADSISARLVSAQGLVGGMPAAHPKPIQKLYAPLTVHAGGAACVLGPGVLQLYSWIKTV